MPSHKAGLLFVNKTSSSRSLSNSKGDSERLREIHKHVQKSRDYEKEKENRRIARNARLLPLGWKPVSVAPRQAPGAAPLPTPPETPLSSEARPSTIDLDAIQREGAESKRRHRDPCLDEVPKLALALPSNGSLEPFGQFKIPMNAERHRILEYFVARFFPAVTRSEVAAFMGHPQASPRSPAVQIVRRALSDELHVLALLTAASARMKFVDRYHFSRVDLPERLADVTLQLLRRYLAQGKPITHQLVQSILYLWAVESYRRNWEAVWTHGRMIVYLTDNHLGGFRNLDPYIQRMLWLADRFQAAATQSPPLVKEQWETDELSPQQRTSAITALREHGKQAMGYGFAEASDMFSQGFRRLLDKVLDLCCVIYCHWIAIPEQTSIPNRQWAVARSHFIADELIGFKDDGGGNSPSSPKDRMQDCVRLALIVWMAFVPASTPYADAKLPTLRAAVDATAMRNRLEGILSDADESSFDLNEQLLLFWIAGLGAVTSGVVENQEWFAVQFQRHAKKLGVFSWTDFVSIQERFLMLDTLKAGNLTDLMWLLQRAVHADVGS
ncbi:hypothetical protein PV04_01517 [Phialophora macrospora]|uniref:Transcription factor domain-containing protein n=1 Tax=Phialophora macrospora TaxID=1851006 RepID=A0A0D2D741_9EURO|nr:hypothetical protein PV04_01517 [Phialophora macrospora]